MTAVVGDIRRVAVVDDNADDRELIVWALEEIGLDPVDIGAVPSLDEAVKAVLNGADALVSDHQLRWGGYADFDGAELVARCFEARMPAVLVTAYVMDSDASIRLHRRGIPSLIPRDELDGERLGAELTASWRELSVAPSRERRPWPALVRVVRVREGPGEAMVDAVVPQWNPHRNVSFPLRLLGPAVDSDQVLEGRRFMAVVNTGANKAEDLYFANFQDAGAVPDERDLL